jgi:hypothetical protein
MVKSIEEAGAQPPPAKPKAKKDKALGVRVNKFKRGPDVSIFALQNKIK